MSEIIKFIPPRVPLTDPRSGIISREWFLFFQGVFTRIGGATGPSTEDNAISAFEDAGSGETNAMLFSVEQALMQLPVSEQPIPMCDQVPPYAPSEIDQLQTELNGLRELVAEMAKDIQALKQAITS